MDFCARGHWMRALLPPTFSASNSNGAGPPQLQPPNMHLRRLSLSATGDAERVRVLEEQLRKVTEKAARARKAKSKREKKRKAKKKDMAKAAKCQLESSKD